MKKIFMAIGALIILLGIILAVPAKSAKAEFLRIHIRADSNAQADQNVKYKVKTAVVDYLTPKLTDATDKQKAMRIVENELSNIESVCNRTLAENGFSYVSRAKLCQEQFRSRLSGSYAFSGGIRRVDCRTGQRKWR